MVVGGDSGFLELPGLCVAELAEGHTDLHAELAHRADRIEHLVEFLLAVANAFPSSAHAKSGGPIFSRALGDRKNLILRHEGLALEAGIVARALRAIAAIFTATPCFHAQQRAKLNLIFRPEFQMNTAAFSDQVEEGAAVDLLEFFKIRSHRASFVASVRQGVNRPF